VRRGRQDIEAGRLVSHDDVFADIDEMLQDK
jgi:predicted transcriptional regulator